MLNYIPTYIFALSDLGIWNLRGKGISYCKEMWSKGVMNVKHFRGNKTLSIHLNCFNSRVFCVRKTRLILNKEVKKFHVHNVQRLTNCQIWVTKDSEKTMKWNISSYIFFQIPTTWQRWFPFLLDYNSNWNILDWDLGFLSNNFNFVCNILKYRSFISIVVSIYLIIS